MAFAKLYSKYKSPSLIWYWEKDHPNYDSIVTEIYKARQNMPLILNEKKAKENPNPNRNLKENLLFVISTCPILIPLMKLSSKQPRAILTIPEYDNNDIIDLRDKYWKHLKLIDGYKTDEFYKLVAEKPYLKERTQEDRETKKAIFSEERFKLQKSFAISEPITAKTIKSLVDKAQTNKGKNYFESEDIPEVTYTERIVGEDFKRRILRSHHDWVVFVEHPIKNMNRDYELKFEEYVRTHTNSKIRFYRIHDFNESDVFKLTNYTSPTVLYFKEGFKQSPAELDIREDLTSEATNKSAFERLDSFIKQNSI